MTFDEEVPRIELYIVNNIERLLVVFFSEDHM